MSEKIAITGIQRSNDMMYFVKNGDVWGVRRKLPGEPRSAAELIKEAGVEMDYSRYLYYVDADGDIARKERHAWVQEQKKIAAAEKKAAAKKAAAEKKAAAKKKAAEKKKAAALKKKKAAAKKKKAAAKKKKKKARSRRRR